MDLSSTNMKLDSARFFETSVTIYRLAERRVSDSWYLHENSNAIQQLQYTKKNMLFKFFQSAQWSWIPCLVSKTKMKLHENLKKRSYDGRYLYVGHLGEILYFPNIKSLTKSYFFFFKFCKGVTDSENSSTSVVRKIFAMV
jgi:hypothetical protein